MIRAKQHPLTSHSPPFVQLHPPFNIFPSTFSLVRTRPTDRVAHESELFRAVRDGVEVEVAEVVARVVLKAGCHDGVVCDAGS